MDKSKIWIKCLTTPHDGKPCGEDCLIQELIEQQMKKTLIEKYIRVNTYTTNVTKSYIVNNGTGEVYSEEFWNNDTRRN